MNARFKDRVELSLKIVAMLIALFGVWKYFAEKQAAADAAAKARSIAYLERYGSAAMSVARENLFTFWASQDAFIDHLRSHRITRRDYRNFIRFTLPRYEHREAVRSALFAFANLYDQIFHCRQSRICDDTILDDYFCPIVVKQQARYGPFYEILRNDIASTDFGGSLERYAGLCRENGYGGEADTGR